MTQGRQKPIPLEELARAHDIPVCYVDLDVAFGEGESKKYSGACLQRRTDRAICIAVSSKLKGRRRRRTVAHELVHAGHFICRDIPGDHPCLHPGQAKLGYETLVERAALEVLAPADLVFLEILRSGKVNVRGLARRFDITQGAMRERLEALGILEPDPARTAKN